jgi:tungstate transport system substrate-binding protein
VKTFALRALTGAALLILAALAPVRAEEPSILVQSTTSTENSGLFGYLLPKFKEKTGMTSGLSRSAPGRR